MTLSKGKPFAIPSFDKLSSIMKQIAGQKPLGMFRISKIEFLCCYESKCIPAEAQYKG